MHFIQRSNVSTTEKRYGAVADPGIQEPGARTSCGLESVLMPLHTYSMLL